MLEDKRNWNDFSFFSLQRQDLRSLSRSSSLCNAKGNMCNIFLDKLITPLLVNSKFHAVIVDVDQRACGSGQYSYLPNFKIFSSLSSSLSNSLLFMFALIRKIVEPISYFCFLLARNFRFYSYSRTTISAISNQSGRNGVALTAKVCGGISSFNCQL